MKVLFVIQGEGRGHLTQALALQEMLRENGHEVVKMLVGKSRGRRLPEFFRKKAAAPVETFDSPNFVATSDCRYVATLRTAAYNCLRSPLYIASICRLFNEIENLDIDLVVNFFDPLCGLVYGLLKPQVPEVSIGHQYLFLHPSFRYPQPEKSALRWLRLYTKLTGLGACRRLALSFSPYADDDRQHISVVPPLLRQEVSLLPRHHGNFITGYLLNPGFATTVKEWHRRHPEVELRFFWDKHDAPEVTRIDDKLSFHQVNDEKFLEALANCRAYATTGGFESVCEAFYMGKPALMVPVHIEQECNIADAERVGAGIGATDFDLDRLIEFTHQYEEDASFRVWENSAADRITAVLEEAAKGSTTADSLHDGWGARLSARWSQLLNWGA